MVVSALVHSNIVPAYPLVFLPAKLLKLEIWRLVSSFLITGPGMSIILDPYFLYTYASQLETGAVRFGQPGDFFFYLCFVGVFIVVGAFSYVLLSLFPLCYCLNTRLRVPRLSARPAYFS